jgi:hypothetical protein
MRPPRALPAAHFDRNERYAYSGDRTLPSCLRNNMHFARQAPGQLAVFVR